MPANIIYRALRPGDAKDDPMSDQPIAAITIRPAQGQDVAALDALLVASFPAPAEAALVRDLCVEGDMVLMLIAIDEAHGRPDRRDRVQPHGG